MHCEHCKKELTQDEREAQLRVGSDLKTAPIVCRGCFVGAIKTACKSIGFHLGA